MTKKVLERIQEQVELKTGTLDLNECELTEIPGELSNMDWLIALSLKDNQLSKIEKIEGLKNLQKLDLSYNQIAEIKGLETLTALNLLDLSSNKIAEIKGLETL